MKTAISIDDDLFEEAEGIAKEMELPRSQFYAIAIKDFIEKRKNKQRFDQLNAAYSEPPTSEELTLRKRHRQINKRLVAGAW